MVLIIVVVLLYCFGKIIVLKKKKSTQRWEECNYSCPKKNHPHFLSCILYDAFKFNNRYSPLKKKKS